MKIQRKNEVEPEIIGRLAYGETFCYRPDDNAEDLSNIIFIKTSHSAHKEDYIVCINIESGGFIEFHKSHLVLPIHGKFMEI